MRESEFKRCRCGYSIIVYTITSDHDENKISHRFFDGHSGDYRQCWVCPGCHDRLDYITLNE